MFLHGHGWLRHFRRLGYLDWGDIASHQRSVGRLRLHFDESNRAFHLFAIHILSNFAITIRLGNSLSVVIEFVGSSAELSPSSTPISSDLERPLFDLKHLLAIRPAIILVVEGTRALAELDRTAALAALTCMSALNLS